MSARLFIGFYYGRELYWTKLWIELFQVFFDEKKKVKVMSDFRLKSGSLLRGENDVEIELENVLDILKVRHSFLSCDFSSLFIHDLDLEIVL